MKYTICHSSIASVQYVTLPDGRELAVTDSRDDETLPTLPLEVRAALNRQFGAIMALPVERRQSFIDSSVPFDVEASHENAR